MMPGSFSHRVFDAGILYLRHSTMDLSSRIRSPNAFTGAGFPSRNPPLVVFCQSCPFYVRGFAPSGVFRKTSDVVGRNCSRNAEQRNCIGTSWLDHRLDLDPLKVST